MKLRLEVTLSLDPSFPLEYDGPTASIGRDPGCELPLAAAAADVVSWRHARIELTPRGAYLSDLGSTNGTFVNDRRITGRVALRKGAYVRLGATGPTLHVVGLDLTAPPAGGKRPPPAPAPLDVALRPPPPAPVPAASATRLMLVGMKRRQHKLYTVAAVTAGCLLVLLAAIFWVEGDRISRAFGKIDKVADDTRRQEEENKRQDEQLDEQAQRLKKAVEEDAALVARLTNAEGQMTELTTAQAEMRKKQEEAVTQLRQSLDDRMAKILATPPEGSQPTLPAGTTLRDALNEITKAYHFRLVFDEESFKTVGVKDIGGTRLLQALAINDVLDTVIAKLKDQLEPIEGVALGGRTEPGWGPSGSSLVFSHPDGSLFLAPEPLRVRQLMVRAPAHITLEINIDKKKWVITVSWEGAPTRSAPPPPVSLESLDWSKPMWAVVLYYGVNGGQYMHVVELLGAVPPHLLVRFPNDSPKAGPRRWQYNTVVWVRTKDNVYAYNRASNAFDRVLTHYVYDPGQRVFEIQNPQDDQTSRWVARVDCLAFTRSGLPYPGLAVMDDSGRFVLSLPRNDARQIDARDLPEFWTPGQVHRFDASRGLKGEYIVNEFTKEQQEKFRENIQFTAFTAAKAWSIATHPPD